METINVFITGGLGFIGSKIARYFVNQGQNVAVATSSRKNLWRLETIFDSINILDLDITDRAKTKDEVISSHPDVIIHSAVFGAYHENDREKIFNVNLAGMQNVLDAYLESKAYLLINTSTISEYGVKEKPFEEDDPLKPLGDYAVSKASSTLLCESVRQITGRKIITTRISNPFGPYERPQDLIPYLMLSRMQGNEVKLNNPHNVRDFIYINDVVECYGKIVSSYDKMQNSIFNVSTGVETSISELVNMVNETVPGLGELKVLWNSNEARIKDRAIHYSASNLRIISELGWRPKYSVGQGIRDFYSWISENFVSKESKFKGIYGI